MWHKPVTQAARKQSDEVATAKPKAKPEDRMTFQLDRFVGSTWRKSDKNHAPVDSKYMLLFFFIIPIIYV